MGNENNTDKTDIQDGDSSTNSEFEELDQDSISELAKNMDESTSMGNIEEAGNSNLDITDDGKIDGEGQIDAQKDETEGVQDKLFEVAGGEIDKETDVKTVEKEGQSNEQGPHKEVEGKIEEHGEESEIKEKEDENPENKDHVLEDNKIEADGSKAYCFNIPYFKKRIKIGKKILPYYAWGTVILLLLTALLSVFLAYNKPEPEFKKSQGVSIKEEVKVFGTESTDIAKPKFGEIASAPVPLSPVDRKLKEAAELRDSLLDKQRAIADLKQHYLYGIGGLEDEIFEVIHDKGLTTYQDVLKEKKIKLNLSSIQRRHLYIKELDQLFEQLVLGSEELLYINRLTGIDIKMVDVVKDMDMDKLTRRIETYIRRHIHDNDKLILGTKNIKPQPIKTIWKMIDYKYNKSRKQKNYFAAQNKINREIWQEICNEKFDGKYKLTELSPEAAKCLSKWTGKDLFLGKLAKLSPDTAKYLAQWQGKWLSLNGLVYLSPDTAKYLSQWKGDILSLNGLNELSPETARYLSQWSGRELELSSLKRMPKWKSSGKKIITGQQNNHIK